MILTAFVACRIEDVGSIVGARTKVTTTTSWAPGGRRREVAAAIPGLAITITSLVGVFVSPLWSHQGTPSRRSHVIAAIIGRVDGSQPERMSGTKRD